MWFPRPVASLGNSSAMQNLRYHVESETELGMLEVGLISSCLKEPSGWLRWPGLHEGIQGIQDSSYLHQQAPSLSSPNIWHSVVYVRLYLNPIAFLGGNYKTPWDIFLSVWGLDSVGSVGTMSSLFTSGKTAARANGLAVLIWVLILTSHVILVKWLSFCMLPFTALWNERNELLIAKVLFSLKLYNQSHGKRHPAF